VGLRIVPIKLDEAVLKEIGTLKGGGHPEVRDDQGGGLEVLEGEGGTVCRVSPPRARGGGTIDTIQGREDRGVGVAPGSRDWYMAITYSLVC